MLDSTKITVAVNCQHRLRQSRDYTETRCRAMKSDIHGVIAELNLAGVDIDCDLDGSEAHNTVDEQYVADAIVEASGDYGTSRRHRIASIVQWLESNTVTPIESAAA